MIQSDVIIFGILAGILGVLFLLRERGGGWSRVFPFVPIILLAYLIPSLMVSFGVIDASESNLWTIAKDYFLTAALVLLTLSIDLRGILGLGPKALIMFLTGTVGVMIGGPVALLLTSWVAPELMGAGPEAIWRGMATVAGSWIGGSANQTALYEIYGAGPDTFSIWIAVDVIVAVPAEQRVIAAEAFHGHVSGGWFRRGRWTGSRPICARWSGRAPGLHSSATPVSPAPPTRSR